MPRAIWSGSLLFGLVNVPVQMFSAIDEKDLRFHLLHRKDDSRIGYEKFCKKEGKPVPDDEIGTAYEVSKGKYVYLEDEDFEAAEPKGYRTFDLSDFVPLDEIDPIYLDRTYYLAPAEGGEKVYAVLARAMDKVRSRCDRHVRDAEQAASRLPAGARRSCCSSRSSTSRTRSAVHRARAEGRPGLSAGARDGRRADRPLCRLVRHRQVPGQLPRVAAEVIKAKQKGRDVHTGSARNGREREAAARPARGAAGERRAAHAQRQTPRVESERGGSSRT